MLETIALACFLTIQTWIAKRYVDRKLEDAAKEQQEQVAMLAAHIDLVDESFVEKLKEQPFKVELSEVRPGIYAHKLVTARQSSEPKE